MTGLFKKLFSESNLIAGEKVDEQHEHNIADSTEEIQHENKRINGKIIKVSKDGYGFISSRDIPFTRIFFHWSALRPDTLKFTELKTGMKVSFVIFSTEDKGYRAIKIKVEDE